LYIKNGKRHKRKSQKPAPVTTGLGLLN